MELFKKLGLIGALTLGAFVVPGQATPVSISFTTTAPGGDWSITNGSGTSFTSGSSYLLSGLENIVFNKLGVTNDPVTADNQNYTLTGGSGTNGSYTCNSGAAGAQMQMSGSGSNVTLSLYGAVTSLGGITNLSSGCNLLASLTGTFTGVYQALTVGQFSFAGLGANGLFENSTLLADLGVQSGTAASYLSAGAGIGATGGITQSTSTTITDKYTAGTEQFTLVLNSVPEPFSFALMGTGLAALIVMGRKRRAARN